MLAPPDASTSTVPFPATESLDPPEAEPEMRSDALTEAVAPPPRLTTSDCATR